MAEPEVRAIILRKERLFMGGKLLTSRVIVNISQLELEILAQVHGSDPNVSETDGVVMILQLDKDFGIMR